MRHATTLLGLLGLLPLALWGCSNAPPQLDPIPDQTAFVDREFVLGVHATDDDGDSLDFSFAADTPEISGRARMLPVSTDRGLFQWTPIAADRATNPIHAFDFYVSDGNTTVSATVAITVALAGEGTTSPVFVQPLGSGTTLDLALEQCLAVPVMVEDPDSINVTLGQEEPLIAGATIAQDGPLNGSWQWCPSPEQVAADDRYLLVLSADDHDNPKTLKNYLLVLRTEPKPDCPGAAPTVSHTPHDVSSVVDLTITAEIADDLGLKYEPLLYVSASPPGDPPALGQMTQLSMVLLAGTMQAGTWGADVPNPVANDPPGSTAELYYVIVAQDDHPEGSCYHLTQAPTTGSYRITVTNPGGSGGLALCEPCSADVQCGDADDNCVYLDDGYYCFTGCSDSAQCPDGYYCSYGNFTSIDGAQARQCIPNTYKCTVSTLCVDDGYEDNDTLGQASGSPALGPGTYPGLKSCPGYPSGDDEDWYPIDISIDTQLDASIAGGAATDLDLALTDSAGTVISKGDSLSSNETISACLTSGRYYLHVYSWGEVENQYDLSLWLAGASCAGACQDDPYEDDDNASQARPVVVGSVAYVSTTNAICAWDDDWYEIYLLNGETVYSTLTFTQTSSAEDLDLYIYQGSTNLTGCAEATPGNCDPNNGAGTVSNERLEWTVTQGGYYYLVVHGWAGAENLYDICIGMDSYACP
jgi:hypothetical protein